MNEADSTPSPSRFCSRFGMRRAALNASEARPTPRKPAVTISRTRPDSRDSRMPAPTRARGPPPRHPDRGVGPRSSPACARARRAGHAGSRDAPPSRAGRLAGAGELRAGRLLQGEAQRLHLLHQPVDVGADGSRARRRRRCAPTARRPGRRTRRGGRRAAAAGHGRRRSCRRGVRRPRSGSAAPAAVRSVAEPAGTPPESWRRRRFLGGPRRRRCRAGPRRAGRHAGRCATPRGRRRRSARRWCRGAPGSGPRLGAGDDLLVADLGLECLDDEAAATARGGRRRRCGSVGSFRGTAASDPQAPTPRPRRPGRPAGGGRPRWPRWRRLRPRRMAAGVEQRPGHRPREESVPEGQVGHRGGRLPTALEVGDDRREHLVDRPGVGGVVHGAAGRLGDEAAASRGRRRRRRRSGTRAPGGSTPPRSRR